MPSILSNPKIKQFRQQANKVLNRSLDKHVKLAVTGFSGSGKTAFITSLIKHLTSQAHPQSLPFFDVIREGRFIAGKTVPQRDMAIPTFEYKAAIKPLLESDPQWPKSTQRINTVTLALKFQTQQGISQHFSESQTLYIEVYDYPGEWLMDLPMLNQDFQTWSEETLTRLKSTALLPWSQAFLDALEAFDGEAGVDEKALAEISKLYQKCLSDIKQHTQLSCLQPGRMLIPGDLDGAPLLSFFPLRFGSEPVEGSQSYQLSQRFEAYKQQVIQPFYKHYFSQFDRQIVLVDLLSNLNEGHAMMEELKRSLGDVLHMFQHGKSGLLSRLFKPKIDKVLFAANKCDGVSLNHHSTLTKLLYDLVQTNCNELKFTGVQTECMAMSAIKSTEVKVVDQDKKSYQCVIGKPIGETEFVTYLPPTPPDHLIDKAQWPSENYEFLSFYPYPTYQGQLGHIRLDHALQFLLGDKLK